MSAQIESISVRTPTFTCAAAGLTTIKGERISAKSCAPHLFLLQLRLMRSTDVGCFDLVRTKQIPVIFGSGRESKFSTD
jgi:hypothetical protein